MTTNDPDSGAVAKSRTFSRARLDAVRERLTVLTLPDDAVVAVCGSYGRLEASEHSDFDYFVLTRGKADAKVDITTVRGAIEPVVEKAPSEDGPFDTVTAFPAMLDAIGGEEDSNRSITRRILFLLETRFLTNDAAGRAYRRALVDRYLPDSINDWQIAMFFLNDIIRYYRTICVDFEFKTQQQGKPWGIRNIKLVFSRKLLYFSGVLAAAQVAEMAPARKRDTLAEILDLSPLERVEGICGRPVGPALALYGEFLDRLGDGDVRSTLNRVGPEHRRTDPVFRDLKDKGHEFSRTLMEALEATYRSSHPIHRALLL